MTPLCPNYFEHDARIQYKRIAVQDTGSQKMSNFFNEAFHFIGWGVCVCVCVGMCVCVCMFISSCMLWWSIIMCGLNRVAFIHFATTS